MSQIDLTRYLGKLWKALLSQLCIRYVFILSWLSFQDAAAKMRKPYQVRNATSSRRDGLVLVSNNGRRGKRVGKIE